MSRGHKFDEMKVVSSVPNDYLVCSVCSTILLEDEVAKDLTHGRQQLVGKKHVKVECAVVCAPWHASVFTPGSTNIKSISPTKTRLLNEKRNNLEIQVLQRNATTQLRCGGQYGNRPFRKSVPSPTVKEF